MSARPTDATVGTNHPEGARTPHGFSTDLRIELRKLTTTRSWWILGVLAVALGATITVLTVTGTGASQLPALDVFTGALTGGVQTSYLVTAIIGISAVAGEYRHRTVTPTYLAEPRRGRVISAKLVVSLGYGTAWGVLIMATCAAIAGPWLSRRNLLGGSLDGGGVTRALIGGVAAIAVMTALGAAVAALVRNQLTAVAGLLVYLFAIEPAINNIAATRGAYPYLPGGAVQALTYTGERAFGSVTGAKLLNPWLGMAVLATYALIITAIAVRTSIRRDIT